MPKKDDLEKDHIQEAAIKTMHSDLARAKGIPIPEKTFERGTKTKTSEIASKK